MNSKINDKIKDAISTGFVILFGIALAMAITAPVFGDEYVEAYSQQTYEETGLKINKIVAPEPMPLGSNGKAIIELRINTLGDIDELVYEGDLALAQRMIQVLPLWKFEPKETSYRVLIPVVVQ